MRPTPRLLALSLVLSAGSARADPPIAGDRPACVSVRTQVYQLTPGLFNHLLYVRNACTQAVSCTITTNANPAPSTLAVPVGREEMANTYLNSPAPVFTPRVNCETVP